MKPKTLEENMDLRSCDARGLVGFGGPGGGKKGYCDDQLSHTSEGCAMSIGTCVLPSGLVGSRNNKKSGITKSNY